MKRVYSFISFVMIIALTCIISTSYAQCDKNTFIYGSKNAGSCKKGVALAIGQHETPTSALSLPHFKGGSKAMCRYINKTKVYPVNLKSQRAVGTAIVQAKVLADSTLTDIELVSSSGYQEMDDEAVRVVKSFPKMCPATQSCTAQDMIIQVPVTFSMEEEEAKAKLAETKKLVRNIGPITLYFENDRPDPRTKQDYTSTEYKGLYDAYMNQKDNYISEAGKGLGANEKSQAENEVKTFFNDSIATGYDRLQSFTNAIVEILDEGYEVSFNGDMMHVVAPTWRSTGDISIKADIMEEVARMYGYENFEAAPITTSFEGAINQLDKDLCRRIKEYLAIRCGMQEIFTYPWMEDTFVNAILQDTNGILALATPPSPSEKYIRSSLLPNLCESVVKNERYFSEFSIFENAQIFKDTDYTTPYDASEKLPLQRRNIAGAFADSAKDITPLFRKAKGVIEEMARYTHMEALTLKQSEKPVWADNVVWLNIFRGEEMVGNLALLNKKASMACGIKNLNVMLFELDLDALEPFRSRTNSFVHLPEYPMADYDVSMLFEDSVKWEDIQRTILSSHDKLLHGASFVDEYRGKQIPAGMKSVTMRLVIGSLEKTLTSSEIEDCANSVLKRLAKRFGAALRTK